MSADVISLSERIKQREQERTVAFHIPADRRRQPRWLERLQQGQTKAKDMTGWRPDGDAA